jgi:Holliday junction resolvase RusA-like endonuclease
MIVVHGKPRGKMRPRFTRNGHSYKDPKDVEYEKQIQEAFISSGEVKRDGYVSINIDAFYQIPKGTSKRVKALMIEGKIRPVVKPDLDNIAKIVLDALNGYAYKDDNQVVDCYVSKWYSEDARIQIKIWG